MNYPVIIKNALPNHEFINLQDEFKYWTFTNGSNSNKPKSKIFFGQSNNFDRMLYFPAATIAVLKIKKHLRRDLRLIRIHSNASTSSSHPEFHIDFKEECNCFTFVLFTNTEWDTNWGGEFIAQDPSTLEYRYVPYIPNWGALIPSHWEHCGTAPSTPVAGIRTSVAFVFASVESLPVLLKENPQSYLYL